MRIAVVHPFFDAMGGSEWVSLTLLKILIELGHQVNLYSSIPPSNPPNGVILITNKMFLKPSNNFFPFMNYIINKTTSSRLARLNNEANLTKLALDNERFVFITGGNMPSLPPTNARVFVYCNSVFNGELGLMAKSFTGKKATYNNLIKKFIQRKYKLFLSSNAQLITNSKFTQTQMMERYGKTSIMIYPPVDIDRFSMKKDNDRRDMIASVIRISPEKNPDLVIDAIVRSGFPAHICCNAIGRANESLYQTLLSKTRGKGIDFYCGIPDLRKDNLLSNSKVYLQMSQETFGISVIESMASGCIPIVPDNSANRETVPFEDLRVTGIDDAAEKIKKAFAGNYDYLLPQLQDHASKFTIKKFKERIKTLIDDDMSILPEIYRQVNHKEL